MKNKLRIGIAGYGNLGKGIEMAVKQNNDIEIAAIFTRRSPDLLNCASPVFHFSRIEDFRGKIDVMILCGGSATDLPEQGPKLSALFNTVDSFDTHARIPGYFKQMDESSRSAGTLCLISTGWDPGLFSLLRLLGQSVLPVGKDYTFWGEGVSQGHSDAIRRVPGVKNGIQYTVPVQDALKKVRSGEEPELAASGMHHRICYVVADEGACLNDIEDRIKKMPDYFSDYNTTVNFITEEELKANHTGMPHGGIVIRSGKTGKGSKQRMEFSLSLESNPEFTASILVAYARAVGRMAKEGQTGARTVFDIPFGYLSPLSSRELIRSLL